MQNLKYVLMVIRGFRDPSLEVDEPADEEKQGLARLILQSEEDELVLRKGG